MKGSLQPSSEKPKLHTSKSSPLLLTYLHIQFLVVGLHEVADISRRHTCSCLAFTRRDVHVRSLREKRLHAVGLVRKARDVQWRVAGDVLVVEALLVPVHEQRLETESDF